MDSIVFRDANLSDSQFLVDTIIEAEKSGTSVLSYEKIFGLSEDETRHYLIRMLEEEIDGCELSVSSFLLAEKDNTILGAVCAWIESLEGIPSTVLKGNLLSYVLPRENFQKASNLEHVINDLHFHYIPGSIQIGLVYVVAEARGQGLVKKLLDEKISRLNEDKPGKKDVYIQVFGSNIGAIKAYEKAGFEIIETRTGKYTETANYLPDTTKILMKRN